MPISASQIAPLLKGTYTDSKAAWKVIEQLLLPAFARGLTRLWGRVMECEPKDFGPMVLAELGARIIEDGGLSPPSGPPPEDFTPWLRTVLRNQALGLLKEAAAKRKRREKAEKAERDERPTASPVAEPTTPDASDDRRQEVLASLTESSPLYVLGLYVWTDPRFVTRDLLEAAARVTRGHTDSGTGLVRSVDETMRLLTEHRERLANGVARNRDAQVLVAWILRSDEPSFESWVSMPARVKSARETITKWKQRALEKLKALNTQRDPEAEEDA